MIRRNTWILLALLVIVIGAAFYLNSRKAQQAASTTPTGAAGGSESLFSAAAGEPIGIIVKDTTGKMVEVARNDSGKWVLKAPTSAEADQASAEAAATQVTSLQVLSTVQLDLNAVGLDKPAYIMTFTFKDGSKHTLNVGSETPIQDGYYTSLDNGPVQIVDKPGIDALLQLLAQPPYVTTPTPPITVTPSAETPTNTVVPTETETPGATGSPAPIATGATPTATP